MPMRPALLMRGAVMDRVIAISLTLGLTPNRRTSGGDRLVSRPERWFELRFEDAAALSIDDKESAGR